MRGEHRAADPGHGQTADTLIAAYHYDGRNYRIAKLLPNGENWDRTDYYYNDGAQPPSAVAWQVLEERFAADVPSPAGGGQGEGATSADPATAVHVQWLWDIRYIDSPVLRWRDADADPQTGLEEVLYYANDANMNVTALVDATPGSQTIGQVVERYVYDPYGRATVYNADWSAPVAWANSRKNEVTYCGYRFDAESQLHHVRWRYYLTTTGKWASRDPLFNAADPAADIAFGTRDTLFSTNGDSLGYSDMHLHSYVMSNPVRFWDAHGLQAEDSQEIEAKKSVTVKFRETHSRWTLSNARVVRGPRGERRVVYYPRRMLVASDESHEEWNLGKVEVYLRGRYIKEGINNRFIMAYLSTAGTRIDNPLKWEVGAGIESHLSRKYHPEQSRDGSGRVTRDECEECIEAEAHFVIVFATEAKVVVGAGMKMEWQGIGVEVSASQTLTIKKEMTRQSIRVFLKICTNGVAEAKATDLGSEWSGLSQFENFTPWHPTYRSGRTDRKWVLTGVE